MLPHIVPHIPEHDVYTEAFFGGGAVYWAKKPVKNETINDRLDIVVNFYRVLKRNYAALKAMIDETLFSRTQHDRALLIIRNKDLFDDVQKAWAFWMCSNFSFMNKVGGGMKYANMQNTCVTTSMKRIKADFTEMLVSRIELTHIENRDAIQVLQSRNVNSAFHFIDPPYPNTDQGFYSGYSESDFEKLLIWCADRCKGKFILCNYESNLLNQYIEQKGWIKKQFKIANIGTRKKGDAKVETIVFNYQPHTINEIFK
jgi:DNA adenine methylase